MAIYYVLTWNHNEKWLVEKAMYYKIETDNMALNVPEYHDQRFLGGKYYQKWWPQTVSKWWNTKQKGFLQ